MPRLSLEMFGEADVTPAAEMLAARHRASRRSQPLLPQGFEEPSAWHECLREAASAKAGIAARESGRLVGFMLGREDLPEQRSLGARWGDPRAGFVPVEGHAVAAGADPRAVYLALYGAVSEDWVRRGFFSHGVHVMAADAAAQDALVGLGFGRKVVLAVRAVDPAIEVTGAVSVRQAGPDDTHAVHRLEMELDLYHSRPPIFMPVDPATDEAAGRFMDAVAANPANAVFLAEQDGEAVGMNSLLVDGFASGPVRGERQVYLYQGIVSATARATGVGEALLSRSLGWARDNGFDQVALHYFSANPTGGPFWRKHGFEAAQYGMSRLVDDRIAWARDWR